MGRDVRQLMVEVPTALADELQRECTISDMTKGSIVRRALEMYLGLFLNDPATTEYVATFREAADYPDRRSMNESAVRQYVAARLRENKELNNRFEALRQEREKAKGRVVLMEASAGVMGGRGRQEE